MAATTLPLVTIVVCVYNAAATLRRCLDSLAQQTYDTYEVLIVDDGSTDTTPIVVREWAEQHPLMAIRITTKKENHGLGHSRNIGIREARGDFVGFVDGDDWVRPTFIEKLVCAQHKVNADIVQTDYYTIHENPSESNLVKVARHEQGLGASMCTKLFRTTLFAEHDIWCPEHINYEEVATTYRLGLVVNRIAYIEDCLYYYDKSNPYTITGQRDERYLQLIDALEVLLNYTRTHELFDKKYDELLTIMLTYGMVGRLWDFFRTGQRHAVFAYYHRMSTLLDTQFPGWRSSKELQSLCPNNKYRRVLTSRLWFSIYVHYSRLFAPLRSRTSQVSNL
ncbi:MAG: glycosyltransferase family 2 protein [Coriobacteriia bacterium]|nr:glycosyltransferase family 2 protein [Coriobacteriia bacterium]